MVYQSFTELWNDLRLVRWRVRIETDEGGAIDGTLTSGREIGVEEIFADNMGVTQKDRYLHNTYSLPYCSPHRGIKND